MATKSVNINLPLPQLEIKLTGDWSKAINLPEQVVRAMAEGYSEATHDISRDIVRIVKRAIKSGLPPGGGGVNWAPLSPATLARYGDHKIYKLSGEFEKAIGIHIYKSRILIGMPINQRHSGGLTLNQLSNLLEFGSKDGKLPGRPLWKPTLDAYGGRKKIRNVIVRRIKKQIIKNTGLSPKDISSSW